MTLDEAKQLKPGDRVLLEAEVTYCARSEEQPLHMSPYNNVSVKVALSGAHSASFWVVSPEAIREKIAPPRRKFKEGDIVRYTGSDTLAYVDRDEFEDGSVFVGGLTKSVRYVFLKLICAVENREDMNAGEPAAAPAELQRGNLASKIGGDA